MMSNSLRWISYSQVKALNGGKQGTDGRHGNCDYIRFPPKFFKNLAIYNGEDTRFYYFPGRGSSWSNYQEDEFNCMGNYDFAFRLPPVPDGTYELRVGYTAEDPQRGMLQFYIGSSLFVVITRSLFHLFRHRRQEFLPQCHKHGSKKIP